MLLHALGGSDSAYASAAADDDRVRGQLSNDSFVFRRRRIDQLHFRRLGRDRLLPKRNLSENGARCRTCDRRLSPMNPSGGISRDTGLIRVRLPGGCRQRRRGSAQWTRDRVAASRGACGWSRRRVSAWREGILRAGEWWPGYDDVRTEPRSTRLEPPRDDRATLAATLVSYACTSPFACWRATPTPRGSGGKFVGGLGERPALGSGREHRIVDGGS